MRAVLENPQLLKIRDASYKKSEKGRKKRELEMVESGSERNA